jgi:carboxynorspermidine decarboxylase
MGQESLAGDMIGKYSFDAPLKVGDKLVFEDMGHYTMVKNTTFKGSSRTKTIEIACLEA